MKRGIDLSILSEEETLNLKICELPLKIEDTWLQVCVEELYRELDGNGIGFKPLCYLADEWLAPDQEPLVGIPFFLAHPALMKLEKKMMLDVEGGTKNWCMKLLRHEAGHAINYAYKLHRRRNWQKIFGQFSKEYADTYRFRPYSKNFVRHLEDYYAQYHPDEDFAETFAVWLLPHFDWENKYKGWKALVKLQYVDKVMKEINGKAPLVKKGKKYWQISSLKITLKNYYKRKKSFYAEDFPDFHDRNLEKIFTSLNNKHLTEFTPLETRHLPKGKLSLTGFTKKGEEVNLPSAADLIKKHRKNILNSISAWTGEKKYIIDDLLETIIGRCRDLRLLVSDPPESAVLKISIYITSLIMNYSYTGRFRKER